MKLDEIRRYTGSHGQATEMDMKAFGFFSNFLL